MSSFIEFLKQKRNAELGITPETAKEEGIKNLAASARANTARVNMALKAQTIRIRVSYSWCKVMTFGPALGAMINAFKVFNPKARFSPYYVGNGGTHDGYVSLINDKDGSFGIGMLPDVLAFCKDRGIPYTVEDMRESAKPERKYIWEWTGYELRDYQETIVENAKKAGIGIVKAQMGMGKTLSFLKLTCDLGLNTLITVPTTDLMKQTYKVATSSIKGARIGMFGEGITPPDDAQIIIATQATLLSLQRKVGKQVFINTMAPIDVLISDEVHKIASGSEITKIWQVVMQIPAVYRFGFSATPFEDEKGISAGYLKQCYGNLIFDIGAKEAQALGVTVPFDVYAFRLQYPAHYGMDPHMMGDADDEEEPNWAKMWQEAYFNYIISNNTRNAHIVGVVNRLLAKNHKVLVVAQSIPHNDLLTMAIRKSVKEEVYQFHGSTKKRADVLNEFSKIHEPSVMVASSIANDGLDIKDITAIVVATAGKSFYQVVQRIGRGLRTYEGKEKLIVVDYDDSQLGGWFHKHFMERKKRYIELGGKVSVYKE